MPTPDTKSRSSNATVQHPQWVLDAIAHLPANLLKEEAAQTLRISPRSVCRYVERGLLKGFHLAGGRGNNRLLITRASVADLLAQSSAS